MTTPTIVVLTEAQHAHNAKLSPTDQAAFLAKTSTERDAIVTAALASDPVEYTTTDGLAIRKSHGPVALMLAKQGDDTKKALASQAAETLRIAELHAAQVLATRASSEIGHLAGTAPVKVAMLRAIESITDEPTRTAALDILKGADAAMAELGTPKGANPATDPKVTAAADKIEALAVKYAAEHKVDLTTARALVFDTPEGAALYAESRRPAVTA